VSQPTLNRFFSLHFLLPLVILGFIIIHLMMLHEIGSSNPSTRKTNLDKVKFHPLYSLKDSIPSIATAVLILAIVSNTPNLLGDVENFNTANPLVAPVHIQPEWYFLFAYVVLRSIPSKLGGVLALVASILILVVLMPKKGERIKFKPQIKIKF